MTTEVLADGTDVSKFPCFSDKELDALPQPISLDGYYPSYKQTCDVCGEKPVVKGVIDKRIAYDGCMCGPHTWGDSSALDPKTWNAS